MPENQLERGLIFRMQILDSTIEKLNDYLKIAEDKADKDMSKLRSKAEKKFKDTEKRLEIVLEDGKLFEEEVEQTEANVMDKYSQRIYEVVSSTIDSISKPEKFTLRTLEEYANNTRTALHAQDEILIKYVKLLKGSKYKRRVKSLSKSLQKLNSDLTKLERFISEEYGPFSDVENTSFVISDAIDKLENYDKLYHEIVEKESEVLSKDKEIKELESQLAELLNHPLKVKYQKAVELYSETQKSIDQNFSNIRKALRKYENKLSKSKEKIDTTLLKELIKDAANCLANQRSLGNVERLLSDLNDKLDQNALKLKKDKRELAQNDIKKLLEGELNQYWSNAKNSIDQKEKLSQELKELELERKIERINNSIIGNKRDRNRIFEREVRLLSKLVDEIKKLDEEIQDRLADQMTEELNLTGQLQQLPEWAMILE